MALQRLGLAGLEDQEPRQLQWRAVAEHKALRNPERDHASLWVEAGQQVCPFLGLVPILSPPSGAEEKLATRFRL